MLSLALQGAVHTRLTGYSALTALVAVQSNGRVGIFDDISPEGHLPDTSTNPATRFPYVTHATASAVDWSTDTSSGAEIVYAVHAWSQYPGAKEVKQIADAIYAALHRYALPVTGANVVICDFEDNEFVRDPDQKTRHGLVRFRILLEAA